MREGVVAGMANDESSIDHNAQAPQMRGLAFDQRPGIEPDPFSLHRATQTRMPPRRRTHHNAFRQ
jgi:hypothetical protein